MEYMLVTKRWRNICESDGKLMEYILERWKADGIWAESSDRGGTNGSGRLLGSYDQIRGISLFLFNIFLFQYDKFI